MRMVRLAPSARKGFRVKSARWVLLVLLVRMARLAPSALLVRKAAEGRKVRMA